MFKTIKENSSAELVEKKSKFIANMFYVETKEEAENIIKNVNKKYHDARHNCYSYRILCNDEVVEKSSDDGEPSGTAGAPMLAILAGNNLANILVVVTRYFGGILLGTGGLVKAYSQVVKDAISKTEILKIEEGLEYKININYSDLEKLKYFLKNNNMSILGEEYYENICVKVFIPKDKVNCLNKENSNELNIIKIEEIEKIYRKYS